MVATVFAVTTILVSSAHALETKVAVSGMAPWLSEIAERSLTAVMNNMPAGQSPGSVQNVVRVVSEKIFTGYKITNISYDRRTLKVGFEPEGDIPLWNLEIQPPDLSGPVNAWFAADIDQVDAELKSLMRELPVEALVWCDEGLREIIVKTLQPVLPGWRPGLAVRSEGGNPVLKITFTPELPMVLAITPSFNSASLPTLLYDQLKDDLLEQVSVFIGLPVEWVALHSSEVSAWVEDYLSGKTLVKRTNSHAAVTFSPAPVTHADVRMESSRYTIWGWSAVYGGTSDKSAELGLHLGRKAQIFPKTDMELYGEAIMELQEWSVEGRFGLRWMPWGDVWLGGEYSTDDSMWWARFSIDQRLHKPYAWLRLREDGEVNAALGWKATKFISFEIHYDSRDDDSWSLRILGNL